MPLTDGRKHQREECIKEPQSESSTKTSPGKKYQCILVDFHFSYFKCLLSKMIHILLYLHIHIQQV